ncbi:hypothetical protein ANCDUO_27650, partial [Ancylostoma duodenale]
MNRSMMDVSSKKRHHSPRTTMSVTKTNTSTMNWSLEDSRSSSPLYARPDSPIYAQPWTHYQFVPAHRIPNVIFAERNPKAKPLTVRNQSFRRMLPEIRHSDYATPYAVSASMTYLERTNSLVYPGSYFSRVTSSHVYEEPMKENDPVDEAEEEFLTELDAQIAELQ